MRIIQPIVEGHGEVEALPVLLRRLRNAANAWQVDVGSPIRRKRHQLVQRVELERSLELALLSPGCSGVLILFDGDRDCPAELGREVHSWAREACGHVPCQVVLAHREYEAWFLATIESLRGVRGIREDAEPHPQPEAPRGAKEQLERRMARGRKYLETDDQLALSQAFSLRDAYQRSRSFRKLTTAFGALVREAGLTIDVWPPIDWQDQAGTG